MTTRLKGFQKRAQGRRRQVRVAVVKMMTTDAGSGAECSCGYVKYHKRAKVVEDRLQAHVNRDHGGKAMWL